MSRRVKVSPLPRDDETNGWYLTMPGGLPPPPRILTGEQKADWVVIGAGYNGLGAARRLAELRPNQRIILLEAQRVGQGAAGRNAGYAIDLPHMVSVDDLERGHRQMRLNRIAIQHMDEIVRTFQVNCEWGQRGKIHAAATTAGAKHLEEYARDLDKLGEPHDMLDAAECARRLGTSYYRMGVFTPGTYLMQPAALVRGLAGALPQNVELYEDSPVTAVTYGTPNRAETPQGAVTATGMILATEAFLPSFGVLTDRMFASFTFGSLTRPLNEAEVKALGGESDWGVIPAMRGGTTLRYTRSRRILVRNVVKYAPEVYFGQDTLKEVRKHHERSFRARFPMLPKVTLEHTWGGSLGLSRNTGLVVQKLGDNLFAAGCQNGVGVAKGTITGRAAAEFALGENSDIVSDILTFDAPQRLPPKPLLAIGARFRIAKALWDAGAEH